MTFKKNRTLSLDDRIINGLAYLLSALVAISIIYPLAFVVSASVSDPASVDNGELLLMPIGFTLDGYREIFRYRPIWIGYRNTILYAVFGTLFNLAATLPCAYALSRRELAGRGFIMLIFTFTMFFSGGLIPTYLAMKGYGLLDSPISLLFPGLVSVYNMIIARTYFTHSIPLELQEAAQIDGCKNPRLFMTIVLPLSAPMTAVIMLYYAVGHWNSYFNALIYLSNSELFPLQLFLRNILLEDMMQDLMSSVDSESAEEILRRMQLKSIMKYGLVVVSSIPILVLYPFLQKYFAKGVMIGAIKG